ncbi:hypothetical protein [Oceaniferula spumae]
MTVVIVMLITLIGLSTYAVGGYRDWQKGNEASQKLRMVYNAQRTYLSEHPTEAVSTLTAAKIIPYFSDKSTTMPTIEGLDGNTYTIKVNVSPPVAANGDGDAYDPSGDPDDGQWDVGG